ncbi:MAG: NrfD/PsrC family molybdoenzyme membrane anchor subunit [Pseudomonadota bacterium]
MNGVETHIMRANEVVDPVLSAWAWEIPLYLFLGGLTAGLMVVGAVEELRTGARWERRLTLWSALAGLAAISFGMLFLFLDLANKMRVYRFYLAMRPTSPMSWGAWILILAYPAMGLWLLGAVRADELSRLEGKLPLLGLLHRLRDFAVLHRRKVLVVTALVGVGLGTYTGILLQTLVARPLWNSGLLGPLFLASGISGAAAFLLLLRARDETTLVLLKWDLIALSVEGLLIALFLLEKAGGAAVESQAAGLLLTGPYSGVFFGLVILGGILSPIIMEALELRGRRHAAGILASVLVLLGGLALRIVLVSAGQLSSVNFGLGG